LGYTKAADLWSLGILTASLLTGDLMIPREDLSSLSQVEIADRFLRVDDSFTRRQWTEMPPRALRFLRRLLVVDPEDRMTAAEAVHHSWYTKPASEAEALVDGIKRINRFWKQRDISGDELLEVSFYSL
jgi:serine/threonine protein kinase